VEFSYRLTGTGWAQARIADDATWVVLTVSYLSDALGDLLEAIGELLEGAPETRCWWEQEPGEYRWIFRRSGGDVSLTILAVSDQHAGESDEQGRHLFGTTQPLTVLAQAIADGAAAVLHEHGEHGYKEQWVEAPFPKARLAIIRELLAAR
jgi:hypothetical protein